MSHYHTATESDDEFRFIVCDESAANCSGGKPHSEHRMYVYGRRTNPSEPESRSMPLAEVIREIELIEAARVAVKPQAVRLEVEGNDVDTA